MLLVTGITGHSGRLFAERLARERYTGVLRCALRSDSNADFLEKTTLNYSTVAGDLSAQEFLDGIMKDVDVVLHIAGIQLSCKIVEAAIRNKVQWAILVHTTGRYSRFKSAAAEYIKIEDDILRLRNKIAVTVLRPTMIYGSSRDRNMYKMVDFLYRHKFFPLFGSGKNLMQPVLAQDLANAYYGVLKNREITINREYNLSGKEPIRYLDLVRTVSHALRRRNIIVPIPMWLSLLSAKAYNALSKKPQISVEQVMRMNEDKVFPHEAASRDFGYSPASFDDGIRGEVEEYLDGRALHS